MSKSTRGISLEELGEAYAKKINESLEKLELLRSYGVDISEEGLEYIEVLETSKFKIKILNKVTGEVATVNLIDRIYKKVLIGISFRTSDSESNLVIEDFYEKGHGKKPLESTSKKENIIFRRAFINVSTKYGNFCFVVEYDKTRGTKYITLYHGFFEDCFDFDLNDFDFHKYGVFRVRHTKDTKFDFWNMGYTKGQWEGPNIYGYSSLNNSLKNGQIVETQNFGFVNRKANDNSIILLDGKLKLSETVEKPDFFDYFEEIVEEYESRDVTSKAYFANPGECLVILKNGSNISIEHKKKERVTDKWIRQGLSIRSLTDGEFTLDDFQKCIEILEMVDLPCDLRDFAISGLTGYINTHADDMNIRDYLSLKDCEFSDIVASLKSDNLSNLVEDMLESLAETFNMDASDIIGESPFAPKNEDSKGKKFLPLDK